MAIPIAQVLSHIIINFERLVAISKKEVGISDRSSVRAREVRRVDVREQNHVTCVVDDGVGAVTGGVT